ncbi:hypothetical protein MRX96_054433 [Rhipicephalus microplus]
MLSRLSRCGTGSRSGTRGLSRWLRVEAPLPRSQLREWWSRNYRPLTSTRAADLCRQHGSVRGPDFRARCHDRLFHIQAHSELA